MWESIHTHARARKYKHAHTNTKCARTRARAFTHVRTRARIHTRTFTSTPTHPHTHTHTHTNTPTGVKKRIEQDVRGWNRSNERRLRRRRRIGPRRGSEWRRRGSRRSNSQRHNWRRSTRTKRNKKDRTLKLRMLRKCMNWYRTSWRSPSGQRKMHRGCPTCACLRGARTKGKRIAHLECVLVVANCVLPPAHHRESAIWARTTLATFRLEFPMSVCVLWVDVSRVTNLNDHVYYINFLIARHSTPLFSIFSTPVLRDIINEVCHVINEVFHI